MADFTVINTNDSGAGSLRQAILDSNAANGADRIVFDSSLSGSTINLTSGQIRISDDLVIEGLGAESLSENVTVDAGGNSRVFEISENDILFNDGALDVTIKRLNITGGSSSSNGGAIYVGGAEFVDENLTISQSIISGNSAGGNGGAIYHDGTTENLTISQSIINGNSAGGDGGAISTNFVVVSIDSTAINGNSAGGDGGGIDSLNPIEVNRSIISENAAGLAGGGLNATTIYITESIVTKNQAVAGGGGVLTSGATIILNSLISENETDGIGGGIIVVDSRSTNNFGRVNTTLIANTTISGNKAKRDGGGIWVSGGLLDQGQIQLSPANLVATNVTITNNVADSDNDGDGNGGGIFNTTYSRSVNIETIPGNITLENSIIADNFDTPMNNGAGFIAPDITGAARGDANNLLGNIQGLTTDELFGITASDSLGAGSDIISANPGLGTLQDNGGLTQTVALLPGSPAINAGSNEKIRRETLIDVDGDGEPQIFNFDNDPDTNNEQLPYDQRSGEFSRIVGGTVDIGAFELSPTNIDNNNPPNTVYRFFSSETRVHFYTASETERDIVLNELPNFSFEGGSYIGVDPLTGMPEPLPVYRFLNQDTGVHLYTISETEREVVQNELPNFRFEGEAFFAYSSQVEGTIPIYRFLNSVTGAHFYTPSAVERDAVENELTEFQSEGIAYYAFPFGE